MDNEQQQQDQHGGQGAVNKKHAGGRPRKDANDNVPLQEMFEASIKRGLVSTNAAVQTQALKNAGDLLNPALGDLRSEISELKKKLATAEEALPVVTSERDQAQAILVIATQAALQGTTTKAELAELRMNFDSKIVQARKELVSEAQEHEWKAIRAENAAKEKLQEVQRQFSQTGLQLLLDEMQKIVQQYNVPEPDPAQLPKGISSMILTAWGHSPTRATYMLSYAKAFDSPNDAFKNTLLRFLRTGLLQPEGVRQLDPIIDFDVRRAVLVEMATRWGVLNEVQRIADDEAVQRRADFLRNTNAIHQAQQREFSRLGYGRSEIAVAEPVSITGFTGECIDPEHCCCPRHNGLPPHLRTDTWLGTRPTEKVEDINARHEVDTTLDYGRQLIDRENLAKRGKLVTVLPPESVTLDGHHSPDDEEAL